MKVRLDYVSNSSSSSFMVLGSKYTPNDGWRLTIEDFDNLEDGEVFFAVFPDICEGDYEIPAPRIVTGREEKDVAERINPLTLAVSGVISNERREPFGEIPVIHTLEQPEELIHLLERNVEDIGDFSELDHPLTGDDIALSRSWCQTGCRGHGRKE